MPPDPPDDRFHLGATEAEGRCPYCGELVVLVVDPGGATKQVYVEDCPVCCRPWEVRVRWPDGPGGAAAVELGREDGV